MTRIGIISDTHGYLDSAVFDYFKDCDEVWHAGDFGSNVAEALQAFLQRSPSDKPLKGVYGNIDGDAVRKSFPVERFFLCEEVKVFMIHIGGYPNRYERGIKEKLLQLKPDLFITGHSHILKVIRDASLNDMLHINPGAAGKVGLHQVRTIVRLKIEGKKIFDVEVVELGKR